MAGRTDQRHGFDAATRMALAESDLDTFERRFDRVDERLAKIMATCLSILVALLVSCIMLVLNLTVGR